MKEAHLFSDKTDINYAGRRSRTLYRPGYIDGCKTILDIVKRFNVEKSKRWKREDTPYRTFCNKYASDLAYAASFIMKKRIYIPNVWWIDPNQNNPAVYGSTVKELTANAQYDWFAKYGCFFRWNEISIEYVQSIVNGGGYGVIIAKNDTGPGHIATVIPFDIDSEFPLMTDAGHHNHNRYSGQWYRKFNRYKCYVIGK